jgi:hypothetical protein
VFQEGEPVSGAKVYFYEPETTTPKDVYTDSALTTPAANPVIADSEGRIAVFLNGNYSVKVDDASDVQIDTQDNVNPDIETETSGGNLIANGSFETAGNSSTDASGWTLTAQSDGTIERITADNYDGTAALKATSTGNGGGQADTNAFFAVSPGRQYEVSFALKCSVADIRNLVQILYFDEDQNSVSTVDVYDEDTSNPTSWEVKSFTETPPSSARFAKLRILGADQSDSTSGEAKFDNVFVRQRDQTLGKLGESNTRSASLGTWYQPSTETATLVTVNHRCTGDGAGGEVQVDKSGGTTADYDINFSSNSSNEADNSTTFIVPAGGQYRVVENFSSVTILEVVEWPL